MHCLILYLFSKFVVHVTGANISIITPIHPSWGKDEELKIQEIVYPELKVLLEILYLITNYHYQYTYACTFENRCTNAK